METSLLSILPNLSIGVISIGALVYVVLIFLKTLEIRSEKHEQAMGEREDKLRDVESEIRTILKDQLNQNTIALSQAAKTLERVVRHLDGATHEK